MYIPKVQHTWLHIIDYSLKQESYYHKKYKGVHVTLGSDDSLQLLIGLFLDYSMSHSDFIGCPNVQASFKTEYIFLYSNLGY